MKGRRVVLSLLLIASLLVTGCWNRRELNDIVLVTSIGLDKGKHDDEYKATFQVINSGEVAGGGGGGGESPGGKSTPFITYSGTGKTLFEAIRKTSTKVPRQMFFAHVATIVVGESLAKEGIQELFDFFERSQETRITSDVFISRGTSAEHVVSTLTSLEKIPAQSLAGKMKVTEKIWSENIRMNVFDVIDELSGEGNGLVISGVKVVGESKVGDPKDATRSYNQTNLQVTGLALIKDGKLIRWLDSDESRGVSWIRNKMKSTVIQLDCNDRKKGIAVDVFQSITRMKVTLVNGKPHVSITIREEGNIQEAQCGIDLSDLKVVRKLESQLGDETKRMVLAALEAGKDAQTDIFGFGVALDIEEPRVWHKIKKEWPQLLTNCPVDVQVEAFIRRPGMRTKSYLWGHNI